jgi:hypothetical protein
MKNKVVVGDMAQTDMRSANEKRIELQIKNKGLCVREREIER